MPPELQASLIGGIKVHIRGQIVEGQSEGQSEAQSMDKKSSFGAGLFAGAIAGMIAAHVDGKLGFAGFLLYFLLVGPIKPGANKVVATVAFIIAAAVCVVLFRK